MVRMRVRDRERVGVIRRWLAAAVTGAIVIGAAGCSDGSGGSSGSDGEAQGGDVQLVASDQPRQEPAAGAPTAEVTSGLDAFGQRAERIVAAEGGNTVLSPMSLAVAFAMAEAGARGQTVDDIAGVFGFPDQPGLHAAMNALTAALADANRSGGEDESEEVVLALANAIWAQSGFDIDTGFLDTLARQYGTGIQTTDFVDDPAGSREAINGWVAQATRDRIPDLLGEDAIGEDTRAMLVNAVYLEAAWATTFAESGTRDEPFHRADGSTVDVPTMHTVGLDARYARGNGYTAVELPYAGGDLAMLIVMPDAGTALDDAGLPPLGEIAVGLTGGLVDLALPRWETRAALDLGRVMTELGLTIPGGDLSGIAPDLEIGTAVHAADITVDEHGTEAAAATAVGMELTAAPVRDEPVAITVDRPFLFEVRHVETGAPLFLGRVVDPAATD
jgi:serine protease inhibitor